LIMYPGDRPPFSLFDDVFVVFRGFATVELYMGNLEPMSFRVFMNDFCVYPNMVDTGTRPSYTEPRLICNKETVAAVEQIERQSRVVDSITDAETTDMQNVASIRGRVKMQSRKQEKTTGNVTEPSQLKVSCSM